MIIELEGMEFHAFHGCLESERRDGNLFTVDFKGELAAAEPVAKEATRSEDASDPTMSDRLEDTVDYSVIYDIVAQEMAVPSDLLEHVSGRIARSIKAEFPQFSEFSVRVSKQNPPVNGTCRWSRVTVCM